MSRMDRSWGRGKAKEGKEVRERYLCGGWRYPSFMTFGFTCLGALEASFQLTTKMVVSHISSNQRFVQEIKLNFMALKWLGGIV